MQTAALRLALQVGLLRHPFGHPDCFTPDFQDYNIEDRSHLLAMPMSAPLSAKIFPGKRYLLDLGCGNDYDSSLAWFIGEFMSLGACEAAAGWMHTQALLWPDMDRCFQLRA